MLFFELYSLKNPEKNDPFLINEALVSIKDFFQKH